ncbi:transporter [Ganoderma sinense ZZ0214-1]|uniref:Transporter n=1 Tax=Ganoderma sinense ZZ0214-1 TaxID=1077348 RepID=A0A2G8S7T1_9APHY|nr:transporter [Ganoderma sinense ZZ0214-1]
MIPVLLVTLAALLPLASTHIALWHPSMYGFNVTDSTFPYDNRPVAPLQDYTFSQWWFHGHLDYPPNPGDIFTLPAGQPAVAELGCNKGVTSYWASSEGRTDVSQGDNPCPSDDGSFPTGAMHTTGLSDVKGCALAIAYESDVSKIQPADFAVFSVNHTCVWTRNTTFDVPARMPPCPPGGCHCAWFWIHAADAGSEQNYMNGFRCNITGSTSDVPLATAQVPRRCGADAANGKPDAVPGNCTYGAKQPFYWFQAEDNNMFEGTYSPPEYTDLYNFQDGAQDDIFADSYPNGIPVPGPSQTSVPTPGPAPTSTSATSATSTAASSSATSASSSATPSSSSATPSSTSATSSSSSATSAPYSSSATPSSSSAAPTLTSVTPSSSSATPSSTSPTSSPSSATSTSLTATSSDTPATTSSSSLSPSSSSPPKGRPSTFPWARPGRPGDWGRSSGRSRGNGNGKGNGRNGIGSDGIGSNGNGRDGVWGPRTVRNVKEQKRSGEAAKVKDHLLRARRPLF